VTLAEYRSNLGLTQQALADQLGIDIEYYKPLEYGKAPVPRWLRDKIKEYEDASK
jgi:transcriptional regulator with XRE-family HTH domain